MRDGATLDPAVLSTPPAHGPAAARVRWGTIDGGTVVIKRATGAGRPALRREAAVLRALAGPDVVRILDLREHDDATELITGAVAGRSLEALILDPDVAPATVVSALAATCDTVSRLHARGWCHGRMATDHVLVTVRGRVRLCSLSAAEPGHHTDTLTAVDRAALLRMVDRWTTDRTAGSSWRQRSSHRRVARRVRRRTARLVDDPDPAVLARILRRAATPHRARTVALVALAVLALVGFSCTAWQTAAEGDDARRDAAVAPATTTPIATAPPTRCPAIDPAAPDTDGDGCGNTVDIAGNDVTVDGARYRIGEVGDTVAIVDTDCDGRATVVDLRTRTGELFEFTTWARPGTPATARPMGVYPGARGIEPPDGTCGPVRVVLADGSRHDTGGPP